jgi:GNAT superfamily N-acetyltransferase
VNDLELIEAEAVRASVLPGGGRAKTVGGAICLAHPLVPIMELNRAIPVEPAVDVDAITAWFTAAHAVCVTPERASLGRELADRGYEHASSWMKFERGDEPASPPETDLRVEETFDAALFGSLVAEGSDIPPAAAAPLAAIVGQPGWRCFVAWIGDEPAASGAIYIERASAWIGAGSTRPDFRRQGAQTALLAARIEAARASGATTIVTETGERVAGKPDQSYRNIVRAGFREAYLRANWRSPPCREPPRPVPGTATRA